MAVEAGIRGKVLLVGAGPGDPELLTLKAARAIGQADVVLHDRTARAAVRLHARPEALLLDVGKRKSAAPWPQARITATLIEQARQGHLVVRLKGGDPGLFGRLAEETDALAEAGIPFAIIPGVSAGTAAPAAAGIPLTRRGVSQVVTFLTGHDETGGLPEGVDWEALAASSHTIVLFMGLSNLDSVAVRLIAAGRRPAEPLVIVSRASLPDEQVLRTTLGAATLDVARAMVPSPALVIVGAVAGLAPAAVAGYSAGARAGSGAIAGEREASNSSPAIIR